MSKIDATEFKNWFELLSKVENPWKKEFKTCLRSMLSNFRSQVTREDSREFRSNSDRLSQA